MVNCCGHRSVNQQRRRAQSYARSAPCPHIQLRYVLIYKLSKQKMSCRPRNWITGCGRRDVNSCSNRGVNPQCRLAHHQWRRVRSTEDQSGAHHFLIAQNVMTNLDVGIALSGARQAIVEHNELKSSVLGGGAFYPPSYFGNTMRTAAGSTSVALDPSGSTCSGG